MATGVVSGARGSTGVAWWPGRRRADVRSALSSLAALTLLASLTSMLPSLAERVGPLLAPDASLTAAEELSIAEQIDAARLAFVPRADGSLAAVNAGAGVSAILDEEQLAVRDLATNARVTLDTVAFGRSSSVAPLAGTAPTATDTTATIVRGPVVEWLRNASGGLEQGWTIPARPAGQGSVVLDLAVAGATVEVATDRSARFVLPGGSALAYDGLAVHDATGDALDARFRATSDGLRVVVDDSDATYPVVIDPVISSIGTLEGIGNPRGDNFGTSVAMDGRWMAVGASADRLTMPGVSGYGSVYVYFDQSGSGDWTLLGQLPAPALTGAPNIGASLALDVEPGGVTIAAGAPQQNRVIVWTFAGDPVTVAPTQPPSSGSIIVASAYPGRSLGSYGQSLDLENGVLVVGAPSSGFSSIFAPDGPDGNSTPDPIGERIGIVEVLQRSGGVGTGFSFVQRLETIAGTGETNPSLRDAAQEFGTSVALDGDLIAVGAIGDDGVLTPTGGTLANPAPLGTSTDKGAVHMFRKVAGTWTRQALLVGDPRRVSGEYGRSVSLAGGDLLVGEPGGAGRAYLYDHVFDSGAGTDTWSLVSYLTGDDPGTPADESAGTVGRFGSSTDFDLGGTRLVIGAESQPVTGVGNAGAVHVLSRPGTGPADQPAFSQRLLSHATDAVLGKPGDLRYGQAVAADGGAVVVGSPLRSAITGPFSGAAYVYAPGGSGLTEIRDLRPIGHRFDAQFGTRVARDGDVLVVAAPLERHYRIDKIGEGAVYVFRKVSGAWTLENVLYPDSGQKVDSLDSQWGYSLDVYVRRDASGNETGLWVAVGAPRDNDVDLDGRGDAVANQAIGRVGTVGVFGRNGAPGSNWAQFGAELWAGGHQAIGTRPGLFDSATLTDGGRFGASVAFTDDGTLLVGEPGGDGGDGQLHRFDRSGVFDGSSPSYTFRETIQGDDFGSELGLALATDGADIVAAGSGASSDSTRLSLYTDGGAVTQPLVSDGGFHVGLASAGVALDYADGRIAVGSLADDAARVYRAPADGASATLEAHLTGTPGTIFGHAVSLNHGGGNLSLVVGAPHSDALAPGSGEVRAYVADIRPDGSATWSQEATLEPPVAGLAGSGFGSSLVHWPEDGGTLVGAPGHDLPDTDAGRAFWFDSSALAPPAGPSAFVEVVTGGQTPVGADYIPTPGLPPSLLSDNSQAAGSIAAAPFGDVDLSQPPTGSNVAASPLQSIPLQSIGLGDLPDAAKQVLAVPLQSIPLQSIAGGWESLLVGTSLEGVPLQSITLLDVLAEPSVLNQLNVGDLAASPLQPIALAAVALGQVPLQSIEIDPDSSGSAIEQWCAALTAVGGTTADYGLNCADPGSSTNDSATLMSIALLGAPLQSIPLQSIPLQSIDIAGAPLQSIPLQSIDVAGSPLQSIPLQSIPLQSIPLQSIPLQSIPLQSIPLQSIPLQSITLAGTPLQSIPLQSIDIVGSPLQSIPLQSIPLQSIPLQSIPLQSIPLQSIPLQSIPLQSIPLQSITLAGTPLQSIPLQSIDIVGSPLQSIPLQSIPLQSIPLQSIPLQSIPLQSIPLESVLETISLGSTPLQSIPLQSITFASGELKSAALAAIPLQSIPLQSIPAVVDCDPFDCSGDATLGDAARARALVGGATLGDLEGALSGVRLGDLVGAVAGQDVADFRDALQGFSLVNFDGFDDLTLGELPQVLRYLTLGDLEGVDGLRLGDIADRIDGFTEAQVRAALGSRSLADLDGFADLTLGELVVVHQYLDFGHLSGLLDGIRLQDLVGIIDNGSGGTYGEAALRSALQQALGGSGATLGDLGPDFDDLTLGELGGYGATTLGQLLAVLDPDQLGRITLGDLLLTLIARSQYPWEVLDLDTALSQAFDEADHSVPVQVAFEAQAPDGHARDIRIEVRPPTGSVMVPGSATLSVPTAPGELQPTLLDGSLVWTFSSLPAGAVHTLTFALEPTVNIGTTQLTATALLVADDVSAQDVADLTVTEVLEPNDTPADAAELPDDTIVLSHVSGKDDLDLFSFDVTNPGTRVSIILSNLDADLDAVLYGPRASSADIQQPSPRSIVPVEDEEANALPGLADVAPEVVDDLAVPNNLGELTLTQASINRGTRDEQIDTGTLYRPGRYYVAVSGYNGAVNRAPYALRLKRFAVASQPACPARTVNSPAVVGSLPAQLPAGTDTVFLVNRSRMAGLYGAAGADAVRTSVDQLVSYVNAPAQSGLGVKAAVLPIDADAGVRAAYAEWDGQPCLPETANGVVAEVVRVLDTYREAGVELRHIVVVGGDDVIPAARVPDKTEIANETGYASTIGNTGNALFATFATSHVLTDDAYGDLDPYGFGDRVLFVTDTAVGRLVESPTEITDQLGDYVAAQGLLDVGTGLVTGYDFLSDGADETADALDPTYGSVDRSLISDTWTRGDLESAIDNLQPDVASINAHFDHFRALPGLGNSTGDESDLFTAAAVRGALANDLAGAIVFSMGCHGGTSASDLLVSGDRALDFAQAISSQGGVFVGNTGYGYGDTELVALSERLMSGFARRLDGALTVGDALRYAKAEYAADLTAYGVYDEKAMMEATLYGLPFYRLDVANPPPIPPAPGAPVLHPDPIAGIDTSTIEVTPLLEERTGDDGSTYFVSVDPETGAELTTAVHDRPVQPRVEESFSAPQGTEAHDALVTELTTTDQHGVDPHILEPVVDDGVERSGATADVAFPSSPVRVNPELTASGETFTVTATAGYFRTTSTDGSGIQRLVDTMAVTPYFVADSVDDFVRPTFRVVDAVLDDGTLSFTVDVADDRGGPERVRRVYVLALSDPAAGVSHEWQGVDLVRSAGTSRWSGSVAVSGDDVEYLVQAVDAAGNVAVTTNKALNFRDAALPLDPPSTDLDVSIAGPQGNAGWYTGPVTVTVDGGSNLTYEVVGSVDEQPYAGPFTLSQDGLHTVVVRSGDGQRITRVVKLDSTGPVAVIVAPPDGSALSNDSGASAVFACLDAGSGVSTCPATIERRQDFGTGSGVVSPIQNGDDVSDQVGRHTLRVTTGSDVAGNSAVVGSASSTFNVVPRPVVTKVTVPDIPAANQPMAVNAEFTGHPLGAPYTATYDWGDGSVTTCRSDQTVAGCSAAMTAGGTGTSSATHTYAGPVVRRDVTVEITDRFGAVGFGTVAFNKTTAIYATPALLSVSLFGGISIAAGQISATLTDGDGAPMAGRSIVFTAGNGSKLCTATTNSAGKASCGKLTATLAVLLSGYYKAKFAGDAYYLGITGTAPLIKIS